MHTAPDPRGRPADTATMRIVHSAMRRDLARARTILAVEIDDVARRRALGEHLAWLMHFLHKHHTTEDLHLYPTVLGNNPAAAELLAAMDAEHRAVEPAMQALTRTASRFTEGQAGQAELVAAIEALEATLLPHLIREETELLPVVSESITQAEWDAYEATNQAESSQELAYTGLWILDHADHAAYRVITSNVSRLKREALLLVFGGRYRRKAAFLWGEELGPFDPATRPAEQLPTWSVSVVVPAPRPAVWAVVSDPTRTPEWSREVVQCQWVGDVAPRRGGRFRGRSRARGMSSSKDCVVLEVVEGDVWSFRTIGDGWVNGPTVWTIRLEDADGGRTRITQTVQVLHLPAWQQRIIERLTPGHFDRSEEIAHELVRLGEIAAERSGATA